MSQAPTSGFGFPLSGPKTPTAVATQADESLDALLSAHSGSSRPTYAVAGTVWLDTSVAGVHTFKEYDGSSDRTLFSINTSTGAVTLPSGVTIPSPVLTGTVSVANLNGAPLGNNGSALINGDGRFNQRGASTVSDDVYAHDMHIALTQSSSIDVDTVEDPADGIPFMWRLEQTNASAQRMGYAQPIPGPLSRSYRGKTVTLGGELEYSNAAAVRFAVLEWTGTADAITSDVVSDWTSGTYTAGNFFISSNLTVRAVGEITPSAATVTPWSITTTIGSSAENIIVFVWTEGAAAQNSTLAARWAFKEGDLTGVDDIFGILDETFELVRAKMFFRTNGAPQIQGNWFNTTSCRLVWDFGAAEMYDDPSMALTTTSPTVEEAGVGNKTGSSSSMTSISASKKGAMFSLTGFSSTTAQNFAALITAGAVTAKVEL